jgi:hypothetical protein
VRDLNVELVKTLNALLTWLMMMGPVLKWWAKTVLANR